MSKDIAARLIVLMVLAVSPHSALAQQDSLSAVPVPSGPHVVFDVEVELGAGEVQQLGSVTILLDLGSAPRHAENFLTLAESGYYEGTTFHRIVPGFIVQGGDPTSRSDWRSPILGTGGPDSTIAPEFNMKHMRGTVAAARQPDSVNPEKASSGSQFYICLADLPALDAAGYTVFGRVEPGMDVVDKIARVKQAGSRYQNRALKRVTMKNFQVNR